MIAYLQFAKATESGNLPQAPPLFHTPHPVILREVAESTLVLHSAPLTRELMQR